MKKRMRINLESKEDFEQQEQKTKVENDPELAMDPEELPEAFNQDRIRLFSKIANGDVESVEELAEMVGRHEEEVKKDLDFLKDMGLVNMETPLEVAYQELILDFGD